MNQNTPLKLQVLTDDGYPYVGFCKTKLAALGSLRRQLGQYAMRRVFYLPEEITAIITSCDTCDIITIMGEALRGFLFQPRNGTMVQGYAPQGYEYFIDGWSWDFDGNRVLVGDQFPLYDDDHCTRLISTAKKGGKWKYTNKPPENYGNVDWKGKSEPGKEAETPVLTYKGPTSRYWRASQDDYAYAVYQNGELLFKLMGYLVYGAALTKDSDGNMWQIGISSASNSIYVYAQPYQSKDYLNLYDPDNHPNGWRLLTQYQASDPQVDGCVFNTFLFNASGSEASSCTTTVGKIVDGQWVTETRYNYYTITIDINNKTATVVETPESVNVSTEETGNVTPAPDPIVHWYDANTGAEFTPSSIMDRFFTGTYSFTGTRTVTTTKNKAVSIVAIDYVGDQKKTASLSISREIRTETNYNEQTEYHKHTLEPSGYYVHGSSATRNTANTTIKETKKLKWNGTEYLLDDYSYSGTGVYNEDLLLSQYYDSMITGFGIWHDAHDGTTHRERALTYKYSSIAFLDLRNDIMVLVKTDRTLSQYRDAITAGCVQTSDTESTLIDTINSCSLEQYGEQRVTKSFYDNNHIFDSVISVALPFYDYQQETVDALNTGLASYRTSSYLVSGGVSGSWAVDVFGNHFYSFIHGSTNNDIYTYLTGCTDIAGLMGTPETPLVYHPIAPL